jgi:hypothetical protein
VLILAYLYLLFFPVPCERREGGRRGGGERQALRGPGAQAHDMTEADLLAMFREVAAVDEVTVIKDKVTKVSRGADLPGPGSGLAILLSLARFTAMPAALFPRSRRDLECSLRGGFASPVRGTMPRFSVRQICAGVFGLVFLLWGSICCNCNAAGRSRVLWLVGGVSAWVRVALA